MANSHLKQLLFGAAALVLCAIAAPAEAVLQKGHSAPPIHTTTTAGKPLNSASHKGQVLIVDFFATWCGPCKASIPFLNGLNKSYGKQGLQIFGMSVDDEGEKHVNEFAAARQISYPIALASDELQSEYGIRSVPTLFVINKKGVVADKFQGYSDVTGRAIETLVKKLLAE